MGRSSRLPSARSSSSMTVRYHRGRMAKFVKQYAHVHDEMVGGVRRATWTKSAHAIFSSPSTSTGWSQLS